MKTWKNAAGRHSDIVLVLLVLGVLVVLFAPIPSGLLDFLPFLLIDLIVASILMALGMMMVQPISISLPLKILMFILVDGWSLLLKGLVGSFH